MQFISLYKQETHNKRINDKRLTINYLMEIIVIISTIKPLMKSMILQVKILKTLFTAYSETLLRQHNLETLKIETL